MWVCTLKHLLSQLWTSHFYQHTLFSECNCQGGAAQCRVWGSARCTSHDDSAHGPSPGIWTLGRLVTFKIFTHHKWSGSTLVQSKMFAVNVTCLWRLLLLFVYLILFIYFTLNHLVTCEVCCQETLSLSTRMLPQTDFVDTAALIIPVNAQHWCNHVCMCSQQSTKRGCSSAYK